MDLKPLGEKTTNAGWLVTDEKVLRIITEVKAGCGEGVPGIWPQFRAKVFNLESTNELQGNLWTSWILVLFYICTWTLFLWEEFLAFRFEHQMFELRASGFKIHRWPVWVGQSKDRNILAWAVCSENKAIYNSGQEICNFPWEGPSEASQYGIYHPAHKNHSMVTLSGLNFLNEGTTNWISKVCSSPDV